MNSTQSVAPIATAAVSRSKKAEALLSSFLTRVDDFDYDNPPPMQLYAVAGMLPAGKVTMLAGEGAVGKTHLMLDLAQKIAYPVLEGEAGDLWLGSAVRESGKVVYVSAEEDREDFHSRLADLGCGIRKGDVPSQIHLLDKTMMAGNPLFTLRGENVVSSDSYDALREFCRRQRPKLVVIDTLNSLCPVNIDGNTAHGQAVMQRLGIIAAESGAALVVTHHINKSGDITSRAAARKAIKGTTGTIDGARNVIVVWQAPEKKGKLAMEAGIVQDEAELFVAAVVKANARGADLREKFFSRDMTQGGAMREVTNMPAEPEQEAPAKRGRGRPRKNA